MEKEYKIGDKVRWHHWDATVIGINADDPSWAYHAPPYKIEFLLSSGDMGQTDAFARHLEPLENQELNEIEVKVV